MWKYKYRPGPGWKCLGGAVWENKCGIRAHLNGMCGFPVFPIFDGREWPESVRLNRFIALNGGNRKRGVMAWAMYVFRTRINDREDNGQNQPRRFVQGYSNR
jgi:hypothetical protein